MLVVLLAPMFIALDVGELPLQTVSGIDNTTTGPSAGPDGPIVPLRRVTLVSSDPNSYIDEFSYISAVPYSVFYNGSTRYLSPLLQYDPSEYLDWFMEDWSEVLARDSGATQLTVIGDVPTSAVMKLGGMFGSKVYPWIQGASSAENAAMLALSEWNRSSIAVVALSRDSFPGNTIVTGQADITVSAGAASVITPSLSISSSNPVTLTFQVPTGVGWIEGSLNWTGPEYFTHVLMDDYSRSIDYSVRSQVYWERFYSGLSAPLPLYFWVPNTRSGQWRLIVRPEVTISRTINFDCVVTFHPGFTHTISVPPLAKSLKVRALWGGGNMIDMNFALLDPDGVLVAWGPSGSPLSSPGTESLEVKYPREGDWTLVGARMSTDAGVTVNLSWEIESMPADMQDYLESAANGAVLASLLNAPLVYVDRDSVPDITTYAMTRLGVNTSILVDPAALHTQALYSSLASFSTVVNLTSHQLVTGWIRSLSDTSDVVLTIPLGNGSELLAPAALSGAFHGAPVFSMCGSDNSLTTWAESTWYPYLIGPDIDIFVTSRYTTRSENGWYDERIPNRYSMFHSSSSFIDFLQARGALDSHRRQQVVILSPPDLVKPSFDRSLQGRFSPGRIPELEPSASSVMVNRAMLHRFLFDLAQSFDTALVTMYAYTHGAVIADNLPQGHRILQYENTTSILQSAGYAISSHVGSAEVFAALSSQPGVWALSTHGTLTRYPTDPPRRPNGPGLLSLRSTDAPYGAESATMRDKNGDQIVNPVQFPEEESLHTIVSTETLMASVGRIGSPIVVLTACLLGGSELPIALMRRGAVAVYGSPRTVYFQSAALFSLFILSGLADGNSTGESLSLAVKMASYDYTDPPPHDPVDYANQHLLFGDPSVMLYNPQTTARIPSLDPRLLSLGTRTPGRGVPPVVGLGATNYLRDVFDSIGVSYEFYGASNLSEFVSLLPLRRCVVTEPDVVESLASHLAATSSDIERYVRRGGILAVVGASGDLSWIPWPVSYDGLDSGPAIEIVDRDHPLTSYPNMLPDSMPFSGTLQNMWANYSVLALGSNDPVLIASVVGLGKVAITTVQPNAEDRDEFFSNVVSWMDGRSLILYRVTRSQEIIWAGDRVTVTLHITDALLVGVNGLNLSVWFNSTDVTMSVQSLGGGAYAVTLNESWTSANIGSITLRLHAHHPGYDTLDAVVLGFMYVRPIPWLIIAVVVGAFAAVVMVSVYRYHANRGAHETHRHLPWKRHARGDRRLSSEEEKRRREEQRRKDEEIDPKELFGID